MIIALDVQHSGRVSRPRDLGASADIDGDSLKELHESEALWTPFYALFAQMRLLELGHTVYPISDGEYSERHRRVNRYSADVYIACHLNAGSVAQNGKRRQPYSALFYDFRSKPERGLALAEAIDSRLGRIEEIGGNRRIWATSTKDWRRNAHYTIKGVKAVAICYEPLFIDAPAHHALFTFEGMRQIGHALAEGIHAWAAKQGAAS